MPPVVTPFVPQRITVHLGPPSSNAQNVTVSFSDYVKNVASSEIYPTWDESALRANILAIVSFALNRVYTEFYRSRGYDFDITSSTAYDQAFVNGRGFLRTSHASLMSCLMITCADRVLSSPLLPNFVTAQPLPARDLANGAVKILHSRVTTPHKYCAVITEM